MKKLFIVVNVDWFFLSHRLPVALAAQKAGWDVTIVTADYVTLWALKLNILLSNVKVASRMVQHFRAYAEAYP